MIMTLVTGIGWQLAHAERQQPSYILHRQVLVNLLFFLQCGYVRVEVQNVNLYCTNIAYQNSYVMTNILKNENQSIKKWQK
jgi:hypothetical protein